jgi:hypothetical protein
LMQVSSRCHVNRSESIDRWVWKTLTTSHLAAPLR